MRRRTVEEPHAFSARIAQACGIYELGGLLLNANDTFTAAVEAYEASEQELKDAGDVLTLLRRCGYFENTCMESLFAQTLGVPFYVFLKIDEYPEIYQFQVSLDWSTTPPSLAAVSDSCMTEPEFLDWWGQHKQTIQTKGYRVQFRRRAAGSYFDRILEDSGMQWGGNIDGFTVSHSLETPIPVIIENRYTNQTSIYSYDPAKYYRQDIFTWKPLILLREQLQVPLLLFTYSRRMGEGQLTGLARVLNGRHDVDTLHYAPNPMNCMNGKPCGCIVNSVNAVKQWLTTV